MAPTFLLARPDIEGVQMRRDVFVSIRMTKSEREKIYRLAVRRGLTPQDVLREFIALAVE
jgi:hypothetical protein